MYNKIAGIYDTIYNYRKDIASILAKHIPGTPKTIIDVGCGTGTLLLEFQKLYPYTMLIGLDISEKMIKEAEKKFKDAKIDETKATLYAGAAEDMRGFKDIDVAVSLFNVFSHIEDPIPFIKAIHKSLRPGGTLIMDFWNAESIDGFRQTKTKTVDEWEKTFTFTEIWPLIGTVKLEFKNKNTGKSFTEEFFQRAYHMSTVRQLLENCFFENINFFPAPYGSHGDTVDFSMVVAQRI